MMRPFTGKNTSDRQSRILCVGLRTWCNVRFESANQRRTGTCVNNIGSIIRSAVDLTKVAFLRMIECHFAKWRHTITLLHHYEARSYADYASGNHRWHIRWHHIVLKAVLCAAIFTTYGYRQLVYNCSTTACILSRTYAGYKKA